MDDLEQVLLSSKATDEGLRGLNILHTLQCHVNSCALILNKISFHECSRNELVYCVVVNVCSS